MLPAKKTEKLVSIKEELSGEMQELIEKSLKSELLCGNSKTIFESLDKIYLFDEVTESFYSKLASNLLISLFILDFTRKLNNNINKKYDIERLDINAVLEDDSFKRYYRDQVEDLEKDKLISWFINMGLPILDECLNKKQLTKLKDVVNIDIEMDLLGEYLERVEDEFDFYEILTQFKKAFEKYPSRYQKFTIKTNIRMTIEHEETQEIHTPGRYENIDNHNFNKIRWHSEDLSNDFTDIPP